MCLQIQNTQRARGRLAFDSCRRVTYGILLITKLGYTHWNCLFPSVFLCLGFWPGLNELCQTNRNLKLNLDAYPQEAESLAKCGEHFSFEIIVISLWFL